MASEPSVEASLLWFGDVMYCMEMRCDATAAFEMPASSQPASEQELQNVTAAPCTGQEAPPPPPGTSCWYRAQLWRQTISAALQGHLHLSKLFSRFYKLSRTNLL